MPYSLRLVLQGEEHAHSVQMSSLMQGVLMEIINTDYAEYLHRTGLHPYSQSLLKGEDDTLIWTVNALNDEAKAQMIDVLADDGFNEFYLHHRDEKMTITNKCLTGCSYSALMDEHFFGVHPRSLRLSFLTPTSFKQNGQYALFPSIRLIFQSLMLKFDEASLESSIFSQEMLLHYEQYAKISSYQLRSTNFHLKGQRIHAFIGNLVIYIHGPMQMVNTAWMLARFGEYSGVGIKSGIGMGAMRVSEIQYHQKKGDESLGQSSV